jgi:hypothetical protein
MYTAGVRGVSRRQIAQLAGLVVYGIVVCAVFAAVTGSLSVSNVVEYALPLVVVPASAGLLVARQRSLAGRLAAATARLRAEEELRLALAAEGERNRVARDLHDVVAHAVSVMVVQAGAARITLAAEPDLTRAALQEVAQAGRAAMAELRRIIAVGSGSHNEDGSPFGVAGIVALVERRRAGGLAVQMTVTGSDSGVPAAVDSTLYRLVQEALTNIVKHAPSAEAEVTVAIGRGGGGGARPQLAAQRASRLHGLWFWARPDRDARASGVLRRAPVVRAPARRGVRGTGPHPAGRCRFGTVVSAPAAAGRADGTDPGARSLAGGGHRHVRAGRRRLCQPRPGPACGCERRPGCLHGTAADLAAQVPAVGSSSSSTSWPSRSATRSHRIAISSG